MTNKPEVPEAEILDNKQCWELLRSVSVGRLAVWAGDVLDTVGLLLFPWQAGRKDHFVRVTPTALTGRRFKVTPPLTWWSPLDDATRAGLE